MARRLSVEWPDFRAFESRDGAPIRILVVSDQRDPALRDARTRKQLEPIDLILGCGDLGADELCFVADATNAPLIYVRGNHDSGEAWRRASCNLPDAMGSATAVHRMGLTIVGLPWPAARGGMATRSERGAWSQALRVAVRLLAHRGPVIVISHAPPLGVGDVATDAYHRGFGAYAWLLRRLRPVLWLHGHTPLAAIPEWCVRAHGTTVVNATGALLIELTPSRHPAD